MQQLHLKVTGSARTSGVPYAVIGVGAGPISNLFARYSLKSFLAGASLIAVRDEESARFVQTMGIDGGPKITADAALTLHGKELSVEAEQVRKDIIAKAAGRQVVVIHPGAALPSSTYDKLYDAIAQADFSNCAVFAISDQANTSNAKTQLQACQRVADLVEGVTTVPYGGLDDLVGLLAAADCIVTTKLHVGIVGSALEKRVLAFPAHSKTERFYRQIQASECCMPLSTTESSAMAIGLGLALARQTKAPRALPEQVGRARLNSKEVEEFLKS